MASTITTPGGVQHIPPQASAGPTVPDPTGAPDGRVVTTASGALVLATPAGGAAVSSATPQPVGVASAGVSADASRADHVHAPSARTLISLASATGWTYDTLGSGSAAVVDTVGETVDLTVGASGTYARAGRAVPWTGTLAPSFRARLAATDASTDAQELGVFFSSALTGAVFVGAVVFGDATVRAVSSAAFSAASDVSVPGILGGEGWVRVDLYGATVAVYAGVGVAGAEPTSWTAVGWATSPNGTRQPWEVLRFQLNASNARTASWDSIRWYDGALP